MTPCMNQFNLHFPHTHSVLWICISSSQSSCHFMIYICTTVLILNVPCKTYFRYKLCLLFLYHKCHLSNLIVHSKMAKIFKEIFVVTFTVLSKLFIIKVLVTKLTGWTDRQMQRYTLLHIKHHKYIKRQFIPLYFLLSVWSSVIQKDLSKENTDFE